MGAENRGLSKRLVDAINKQTAQEWYRQQHREPDTPVDEDEYEPIKWPFTLTKADQTFLRIQGISLR